MELTPHEKPENEILERTESWEREGLEKGNHTDENTCIRYEIFKQKTVFTFLLKKQRDSSFQMAELELSWNSHSCCLAVWM